MTPRDKAIGSSAVVEFLIRHIERELAEGRREAAEFEDAALDEKFDLAQVKVRKAHRALEALQAQLAESFGAPLETRSGGDADDKDPPTVP